MRARLVVDPTRCRGDGICALRLPERIGLDEWGYPVVAADPLTPELEHRAKAAAATCPALALRLIRD